MSQSATPATQNDMTTCLETFAKERFCSFPHRHGDATGKPETRDKTHGCRKTRSSYETSSNFYTFDMLRHGHTGIARTVADGCGRERNVERTHPQPPDPQSETGTLATHSGKTAIRHNVTRYAQSPPRPLASMLKLCELELPTKMLVFLFRPATTNLD